MERLQPKVGDQIDSLPMSVPSQDQNVRLQSTQYSHESQPLMAVGSTDQIQPSSIHGLSFDGARFWSGSGTLSIAPRADLSTIIHHDESKTGQSEPSVVLPLTVSDNQQSTSETIFAVESTSSYVPSAESNNLIVRKSSSERNTRDEADFEKGCMRKYTDHAFKKTFDCDTCEKKFTTKRRLVEHIRVHHTGERSLQCKKCDRSFKYKRNMSRHLCTHTGEKPFRCTECPAGFIQKSNLISHFTTVHATKKPLINCGICGRAFSGKRYLRHHLYTEHNVQGSHFVDHEVNRELSQKDNQNAHSQTQAAVDELLQCDICWQKFSRESELKAHCSINNCKKLIICDICNRGFLHPNHLSNHICKPL